MKKVLLIPALCFSVATVFAQPGFKSTAYIDVNNIKAPMGVHGNMWLNLDSASAACEFPKGSGKHIGYSGGLWLGGTDVNANVRTAAHQFDVDDVDFWPGPLNYSFIGPISYNESQAWAKVWKIKRTDIQTFLNITNHTVANTPASILEWPANGNQYIKGNGGVTIPAPANYRLASFIDAGGALNDPNTYDPLLGDYPDMKGDQALWCVFNDYGPHNVSKGLPIGVQVSCMAYAYQRNSTIDNVIFYEYEVYNVAGLILNDFRVGFFADMDLGSAFDDYVGYDSSRNMGIVYNGNPTDGTGDTFSYGNMIPKAGIRILEMPGSNCANPQPAGSFMVVNNAGAGANPITRDPDSAVQFNNYLRSTWRNGQHLTNDYQQSGVPSTGTGTGANANYIFNGDPADSPQWSECKSMNPPGDRRMIIAGGDITLMPGAVEKFAFALVASTPALNNACPTANFSDIQIVSDTAMKIYCNPLPVITGAGEINNHYKTLKFYPNPAKDILLVEMPETKNFNLEIFDALGRKMTVNYSVKSNRINVDIHTLPEGFYSIRLQTEQVVFADSFIKE